MTVEEGEEDSEPAPAEEVELTETQKLDAEFGMDGVVWVEEALAGMTRVVLAHPSGRRARCFLLRYESHHIFSLAHTCPLIYSAAKPLRHSLCPRVVSTYKNIVAKRFSVVYIA